MAAEIRALTSLRGVAACAVVAMHFSSTMQLDCVVSIPSLAPHGYLAVDMFFVLSGFIMAYTYLASFQKMNYLQAYRAFIAKRIARIMPLNVAIVTLIITISSFSTWIFKYNPFFEAHPHSALEDFFTNVFMLPGIGIGNSVDWPAWSISVEFAAYLIFPILILIAFYYNWKITIFIGIFFSSSLLYICLGNAPLNPDGFHAQHALPIRDLIRCFSEFILGLLTYRVFLSGKVQKYFLKDTVAFLLFGLVAVFVLFRLGDFFAILLFPLIVLALALNRDRAAQIMGSPVLYFLGMISFSLYLVHDPFRAPILDFIRYLHPAPLSAPLALAAASLSTIMMILPASAAYWLIERPGRTFVRRLLQSKSAGIPKIAETPSSSYDDAAITQSK